MSIYALFNCYAYEAAEPKLRVESIPYARQKLEIKSLEKKESTPTHNVGNMGTIKEWSTKFESNINTKSKSYSS